MDIRQMLFHRLHEGACCAAWWCAAEVVMCGVEARRSAVRMAPCEEDRRLPVRRLPAAEESCCMPYMPYIFCTLRGRLILDAERYVLR